MRVRMLASLTVLALVVACGKHERAPEEAPPAADTVPGATATPGGAAVEETAVTRIGGSTTAASSAEETGAPQPPGGYAVDSRPAGEGKLASIEYASPQTVAKTAGFYDAQMRAVRRVELGGAGGNVVVYGLSPNTSISAASTMQDVQGLLERRSEPILVIAPWRISSNDPLVRALRGIGQDTQADALLQTLSKVTVVYAIR